MGKTIDDYIVGHSSAKNRDRSDGTNAFIIMNIFIPSISILCNKNDFSKTGSNKLSVRLLATSLALLKKY